MSFTVEIFDPGTSLTEDVTDKVNSIVITKELDNGVTAFAIESKAEDSDPFGSVIFQFPTVKQNTDTLITGIIVDQTDRSRSNFMTTSLTCQDFGYVLTKRIVAENYDNKTIAFILNDVLAKKVPEFTRNNLDPCPIVIPEARFVYSSVSDVLDYLFKLAPGWHYYIDSDKDFHFFEGTEGTGPTVTAAKIKTESLVVNHDGVDHFNRVWIIGRREPSQTEINQFFTSNGQQAFFGPLPNEPFGLKLFFTPAGLPEYQLSIVAEGSETSGAEAVFSAKKRTFYLVDPTTFNGTIRANYRPMRQVIEYFENIADQNKYFLMEKAIKNLDVVDRLEARRYGKAEVQKSSSIMKTLTFTSEHPDLINAQLGQRASVNIVKGPWNIVGDYLITKITQNIFNQRLTVVVEVQEI